MGEQLTTNYLGNAGCAPFMSTPARRHALLTSKLFTCACARCVDAADPTRSVPCPGCHPRTASAASEHELSTEVALEKVAVHYAAPLASSDGARWACEHCHKTWSAEAVLPGPGSGDAGAGAGGGLTGRAWEAVVEQHVLNLDRRWMEDARWGLLQAKLASHSSHPDRLQRAKAACAALLGDAHNLYSMVVSLPPRLIQCPPSPTPFGAHCPVPTDYVALCTLQVMAMGARHWTARRSKQIVTEMASMLCVGPHLT
jgi:hypothetical protein